MIQDRSEHFLKNTRKVVLIPIVRMLFSGYICNHYQICRVIQHHSQHKEATNQSLNQKSRCFYIGAFAFIYFDVLKAAWGQGFGLSAKTRDLSHISMLQLLHTPLTSISTCSTTKPFGSFMGGTVTPSRHTVLPQALQTK